MSFGNRSCKSCRKYVDTQFDVVDVGWDEEGTESLLHKEKDTLHPPTGRVGTNLNEEEGGTFPETRRTVREKEYTLPLLSSKLHLTEPKGRIKMKRDR